MSTLIALLKKTTIPQRDVERLHKEVSLEPLITSELKTASKEWDQTFMRTLHNADFKEFFVSKLKGSLKALDKSDHGLTDVARKNNVKTALPQIQAYDSKDLAKLSWKKQQFIEIVLQGIKELSRQLGE